MVLLSCVHMCVCMRAHTRVWVFSVNPDALGEWRRNDAPTTCPW